MGGRVSQLTGLAPWPLQLGPEFIHGDENNVLKAFVDAKGWKYDVLEWPDRYFFGKEKQLVDAETADKEDPDVMEVHRLFEELPGVPTDRDVTALEWLRDIVGASERVIALAESIYANDFGCSLSIMGMHEAIVEQRQWNYGEKYLVLDRSLGAVASELGKGLDVRLNHKVTEVRYASEMGGVGGAEMVVVRGGPSGVETVEGRRCILAAPITSLKNGITFEPPLPAMKMRAVDAIKMSNAVKIFLAFDAPFWPADLFDVVCADCFLPELWILKWPDQVGAIRPPEGVVQAGLDPSVPVRTKEVVTFFACGVLADRLSAMDKREVVERALDQLDDMFGTAADPKPSRGRLTGSYVADWSAEQTVEGAYTYPSFGAMGSRGVLAAPVGDKLFFAGEATHAGVNPCMQGAMETGLRAAAQVLACERGPRSRM